MEDMVEPAEKSKGSARKSAILVGAVAVALAAPLIGVIHRRKAVIPERDDGFRPIAQLTGRERETPRFRLQLPAEAPKPAAPAPKPQLASVVTLPSPKAAPMAKIQPRPPAKKPTAGIRRVKKKPAPAAKAPAVFTPIFQPPPADGEAAVFWPAPKIQKPAPAPTPAVETAPAPSRVRGRRAAEPFEIGKPDKPGDIFVLETKPRKGPAIIVEHVPKGD